MARNISMTPPMPLTFHGAHTTTAQGRRLPQPPTSEVSGPSSSSVTKLSGSVSGGGAKREFSDRTSCKQRLLRQLGRLLTLYLRHTSGLWGCMDEGVRRLRGEDWHRHCFRRRLRRYKAHHAARPNLQLVERELSLVSLSLWWLDLLAAGNQLELNLGQDRPKLKSHRVIKESEARNSASISLALFARVCSTATGSRQPDRVLRACVKKLLVCIQLVVQKLQLD